MSAEDWTEESDRELHDQLRATVLGHLRLGKLSEEEILERCRDRLEEVPESEHPRFEDAARVALEELSAQLTIEREGWAATTDCDRLDNVEATLRDQGILLWQASPCCDSCTGGELESRLDELDERFSGFRERARGYAFFIDQTLPESLAEGTELSIFLGYGWIPPGKARAPDDVYKTRSLEIARTVCDALIAEGFDVDWNGAISRKIGLTLNWQRRTPLD